MINLIKGEIKKILSKKSFLIVTVIFILYALLTNIIYKTIADEVFLGDVDITELKELNSSLDLSQDDDLLVYVDNLTIIEIEELKEGFSDNTAKYLIEKYLLDLYYAKNECIYITKDSEQGALINQDIDMIMSKIRNNDWQYFTNLEIASLTEKLEQANTLNKVRYQELIKLEEYRLDNNVGYNRDNYLYEAIDKIEMDLMEYYNLLNKDNRSKEEEERFLSIKRDRLINEYILDNYEDVNNTSNLRAVLSNFPNEFGLFILIYLVMISGTIVSEEFNKGTIKYLLTKPYNRRTILTAKLLAVLILLPIIIVGMVIIEIIVGGLVLGFESLSVPVILCNYDILVVRNIFVHLFLLIISILPMYLVLMIICFALSTITASSSAAITITFLFYLFSNVISSISLLYNIKFLKYFISLHWDFTYLVILGDNQFGFKAIISGMVILIYISVIMCVTYAYFGKKDVKNI